jgi:hypothetical protein
LDGAATPSSCLVAAVVGTVALGVSPSPSRHCCGSASTAHRWNLRCPAGRLRGRVVEDVPTLATPFVALSGLRASCVRVSCPRVWCPRASCPRRVGSWSVGAAGQRLAVGTGQLRRGRPPPLRAARLLPGLTGRVVAAGGGRAGRGSRLQSWPPPWAALRRRLGPGSTTWPTRDSRSREGRLSGGGGSGERGVRDVRPRGAWLCAGYRGCRQGQDRRREALMRWLDPRR